MIQLLGNARVRARFLGTHAGAGGGGGGGGGGSPTFFAQHNFGDGTLGPFNNDFALSVPGSLPVIDDPTGVLTAALTHGFASGKVVDIHYVKDPGGTGDPSAGITNMGPVWDSLRTAANFKINKAFLIYFDHHFTNNDGGVGPGDQRKVTYDLSLNQNANEQFSHEVIRGDGSYGVETGSVDASTSTEYNSAVNNFARLRPFRPYFIEIRYEYNDVGVANGRYTVKINGVPVLDLTNVRWINTAGDGFGAWFVGYEEIVIPYQDEHRYLAYYGFADNWIFPDATPTEIATATDLFADKTNVDGHAATTTTFNVTAYNQGGQALGSPSLSVDTTDHSVMTATVSGTVVTVTRVGAGTANVVVTSGAISITVPGTIAPAFDLLGSLTTHLGGDANYTIFSDLFPSSLTISGGKLTAWADARGGGSPVTMTAATGQQPTYASGSGAAFTGAEFLSVAQALIGVDNWAISIVGNWLDPDGLQKVAAFVGAANADGAGVAGDSDNAFRLGALLGGVSWVVSDRQLTGNTPTGFHVFTVKRESGVLSFNLDGTAVGGGTSTAPNTPTAESFIGGDGGFHEGHTGTQRAILFVNNNIGSGAVENAIADLLTAYS